MDLSEHMTLVDQLEQTLINTETRESDKQSVV